MSKLKDLQIIIQNDRRIWVVAGVLCVGILFWIFTGNGNQRFRPGPMDESAGRPSVTSDSTYKDLVLAFQRDIENYKNTTKSNEKAIVEIAKRQEENQAQNKSIFESILTTMEQMKTRIDNIPQQKAQTGGTTQARVEGVKQEAEEPDDLETIGFDKTDIPPPPKPAGLKRVSVISPGDIVRLKLLTGVNAPVDGTPYPVVFKFAGPITGPDGSSLDLGEARLVAAATGSETDSRALFRLTDLSFRHPDGRRSVVKVDGWIVGEDGVRGMRGTLIDKLGRLIVATAGVSGVAALADRLDNKADSIEVESEGDVNVNADDINVATASAITDAANRLGQVLIDRYEKLIPVVEVLSGREVYAIFSEVTEVDLLDDSEGIYSVSLD